MKAQEKPIMMRNLVALTVGVSSLLLTSHGAFAAESVKNDSIKGDQKASYFVIDTTTPMTEFQLRDLCNKDTNIVANKLTEVAGRLTGNPTSMQVVGYYGITPLKPQSPGLPPQPGQIYRSYCYLNFASNDKDYGFKVFSAVHHTHLNNSTWDTACKPEYDTIVADQNTLVTDYIKSATLFQGKICEVTAAQVVKN